MLTAAGNRREPRRGYRGVVSVTRCLGESEVAHRALDISSGGCFVLDDDPPEVGEIVIVALDLPGVGRLSMLGRVAHNRRTSGRSGYGIEFLDLSDGEIRALRRACQSLPPQVPG